VEIAKLRVKDVYIGEQFLFYHVKGGWYKRTPISQPMADTLEEYLLECKPTGPALFTNQWGRPIDRSWIERFIRTAGKEAGIHRLTPRILGMPNEATPPKCTCI
jgi:integrase